MYTNTRTHTTAHTQDASSGKWAYGGADVSVAHVAEFLRLHGPFDGLIGFSQGGAMAAIAVAGQLHGELLQVRLCGDFALPQCRGGGGVWVGAGEGVVCVCCWGEGNKLLEDLARKRHGS